MENATFPDTDTAIEQHAIAAARAAIAMGAASPWGSADPCIGAEFDSLRSVLGRDPRRDELGSWRSTFRETIDREAVIVRRSRLYLESLVYSCVEIDESGEVVTRSEYAEGDGEIIQRTRPMHAYSPEPTYRSLAMDWKAIESAYRSLRPIRADRSREIRVIP